MRRIATRDDNAILSFESFLDHVSRLLGADVFVNTAQCQGLSALLGSPIGGYSD